MIWLKAIICLKMNIHLASFDNLGQIIMSWVLRPICTNLSTKLYRGQVIVLTEIITVGADLVSARARDNRILLQNYMVFACAQLRGQTQGLPLQ